jgi:hypothetical protein
MQENLYFSDFTFAAPSGIYMGIFANGGIF